MPPDREERKKARRERIAKRALDEAADASRAAGNGRDGGDAAGGSKTAGEQQIINSVAALDSKKREGIEKVTTIRVEADRRENERRGGEETKRQHRLERLQHEAVTSAKANAAIEMKWTELLQRDIPQELHQEIESQKVACRDTIHNKDALIREFQQQLKAKDEEYVKALRQQAIDVDDMLEKMRTEFTELEQEYENELEAIEDAHLEEREQLLAANKVEIDTLFERRREMEIAYMHAKQKREEQYQQEIEDLLVKDGEQYSKLKIELETNIQTLKQQLEEIRATYQLNTEKLDYNFRVLTELDLEKSAELTRYRRKQAKLKDQLNQYKQRYHEMDSKDRRRNDDLTEEYRQLTKKYKGLQGKFRHFELADTQKYEEVWHMHDEETRELVERVLRADQIISEQQLGWRWKGPNAELLETALAGAKNSHSALSSGSGAERGTKVPGGGSTGGGGSAAAGGEAASSAAGNGTGSAPGADGAADGGADVRSESKGTEDRVTGAKVRAVLRVLAEEAGFLLEPEVQKAIDSLPEEEAEMSQAEGLLRALGLKSEEDVRALVSYFFRDTVQGASVAGALSSEEAGTEVQEQADQLGLDSKNTPVDVLLQLRAMIRPEDVIRAVQAFMEDRQALEGHPGTVPARQAQGGESADTGNASRRGVRSMGQREYWDRLGGIVSEDTFSVWKQLERDLSRYTDMLTDRADRIHRVESLSSRNAELRGLLNKYLADPSNDHLIVPPAQTLKLPGT